MAYKTQKNLSTVQFRYLYQLSNFVIYVKQAPFLSNIYLLG